MRRAAVVLAVLGVLAPVAAAQTVFPTFRMDSEADGRGALDIVRVAMARLPDGRVRGEVTMEDPWTTADLRAPRGAGGSICLTLHTRREPGAEPPDWLVCATAPEEGDVLRGRVLRERANGLARQVGVATVSRPTRRMVRFRFDPVVINRPAGIRFAAEAVTRARRCPRPLGCRDTAPDSPATANLPLRSAAASR